MYIFIGIFSFHCNKNSTANKYNTPALKFQAWKKQVLCSFYFQTVIQCYSLENPQTLPGTHHLKNRRNFKILDHYITWQQDSDFFPIRILFVHICLICSVFRSDGLQKVPAIMSPVPTLPLILTHKFSVSSPSIPRQSSMHSSWSLTQSLNPSTPTFQSESSSHHVSVMPVRTQPCKHAHTAFAQGNLNFFLMKPTYRL